MSQSTSTQRHLLVVDDDKLIVTMLTDIFKADYVVRSAYDGKQALELIRSHSFTAVLCDHMMPGLTGVSVLKDCITLQPHAVRILCTASESASDIKDAINVARVHRVVGKPFRQLDISSTVASAIREAELSQENERLVGELTQALASLQDRERELEHELTVRTQELMHVMGELQKLKA